MVKVGKMVMAAISALVLGGMMSTTANASRWHSGTPKAIRGEFQAKRTGAQGFGSRYSITRNQFVIGISNMPTEFINHLKYQKIGKHLYRVKGHVKKNAMIRFSHVDFAVYRKGKVMAFGDFGYQKTHKFVKSQYARQVKAYRNGEAIFK
ncbi:hypothetical protein FD13_GL001634 [Levilactobacillus senmaizukei DSM 21775 = NBRC 103853]|uniref:Uncharacterized protein n=1 Tax=Levilactobacillus senmaizukei DSM 21775 = NBRC 103853 TaxID=1423803 RepID=A0A0R2DRR8_9LACO|nr:hypothetical protein [Levilactobacillus senmaizukei]KRN02644.1 hypothetical protein FD13_GL001634 [Levilactobacillus senmaizukei DSM 21775 = NBRC 103853]